MKCPHCNKEISQTLEREREQVVKYLRELMLNLDPDTAESIDMYISKLDSHE